MSEKFPSIRHVILDEVQAFQIKDGYWLGKANILCDSMQAIVKVNTVRMIPLMQILKLVQSGAVAEMMIQAICGVS